MSIMLVSMGRNKYKFQLENKEFIRVSEFLKHANELFVTSIVVVANENGSTIVSF